MCNDVLFQLFWLVGYIGEFEYVDDHRPGKIVVELNGRLNKCGVISPRFDVGVKEIEGWTARLLPSRQVRCWSIDNIVCILRSIFLCWKYHHQHKVNAYERSKQQVSCCSCSVAGVNQNLYLFYASSWKYSFLLQIGRKDLTSWINCFYFVLIAKKKIKNKYIYIIISIRLVNFAVPVRV